MRFWEQDLHSDRVETELRTFVRWNGRAGLRICCHEAGRYPHQATQKDSLQLDEDRTSGKTALSILRRRTNTSHVTTIVPNYASTSFSFPLPDGGASAELFNASCQEGMAGLPTIDNGDDGVLEIDVPRFSNKAFKDLSSCCSSARDWLWVSLFFSII